jgi:hypothetical protein
MIFLSEENLYSFFVICLYIYWRGRFSFEEERDFEINDFTMVSFMEQELLTVCFTIVVLLCILIVILPGNLL